MKLTDEEKSLLAGEEGPGAKKAMEILTALGKIFDAQKMVPVASAQVAGVSYRNIGDYGLEFLRDWAELGTKTRIPAFMNPAGMDRNLWQQLGISENFAEKQLDIITQLQKMGVSPTLTCTPYHIGHTPNIGQHIAWSESSAVSYANSVLGAFTNREGGPSALAAAIVGRTPKFGLHLEENRLPTHHIYVSCKLEAPSDYGLLGYMVGKQVADGIPYFEGLEFPDELWKKTACFKALGAAMAASGAVALYHVHAVTPEAKARLLLSLEAKQIKIENLRPANSALKRRTSEKLDLVTLGCPHSSLEELNEIADFLKTKQVKVPLWITTSLIVRQQAEKKGLLEIIKKAGGIVIADTCMVVTTLKELGYKYIAVNSAKAAYYLPSHQGAVTYLGTTEQCINAAVKGKWKY